MAEDYVVSLNAAIGRAVIEWNRLEYTMIALGTTLGECLCPGIITDPHNVLRLAFINMNLSARIATVKAYASQCKIEKDFYGKLEKLLNQVDNELRLKRNRYVHDFWDIGDPDSEQVSRIGFKSHVSRPQSYKLQLDPLQIATYENVQEVSAFGDELRQMVSDLGSIQGQVSMSEPYKAARKIAETTSPGKA